MPKIVEIDLKNGKLFSPEHRVSLNSRIVHPNLWHNDLPIPVGSGKWSDVQWKSLPHLLGVSWNQIEI